MERSVSVRTLITVVLALAVVATAYLVGGAGSTQAASTPAATSATPTTVLPRDASRGAVPGTLTMSGEGEVVGVPDEMTFRVAVTRKRDSVPAAMDAASATNRQVLAALEAAGVEREDVQTTGLSVDPEYDYPAYGPAVLTGYRVRQSASVVVRDLRAGGRAVAAATRAGGDATRVWGIGLRIGDRDALLARARDAAVEAATAKAEQYAAATGQSLGQVLTLTEGRRAVRASRPQLRDLEAAGYRATVDKAYAPVPIRAGSDEVTVDVSIVWHLVPADE